jgi:hypothetical protein
VAGDCRSGGLVVGDILDADDDVVFEYNLVADVNRSRTVDNNCPRSLDLIGAERLIVAADIE